ncbi:MAG: hypothetical protein VKP62_08915 [Candidatus Sericytochromatia bacterium]|nr:hypothetical protein [Candidatus Sericytochromatia bacterium]
MRDAWLPTLTALSVSLVACAPFDPSPMGPVLLFGLIGGPQTQAPGFSQVLFGTAENGRGLMANAEVRVFNAATGQAIPIRFFDSGKYRLSQTGPRTDAQGRFSFHMPVPRKGDVYRVVVSDGKYSVTTLIATISAKQGRQETLVFRSLSTPANESLPSKQTGFQFLLTPATTLADNCVRNLIPLAQALTDDAESQLFLEVLNKGESLARQIARTFTASELDTLSEVVDAKGTIQPALLAEVMGEAGLGRVFRQTVAESLQVLSTLKQDGGNLDTSVETGLTQDDLGVLASAGFDITITGTVISIAGNGVNLNFDLPNEVATPSIPILEPFPRPTPTDSVSSGGGSSRRSAPPTPTPGPEPAEFDPTFTVSYLPGTQSLQMTVSQTAGQEDVFRIIARLSKARTGAVFTPPPAILAEGTSSSPIASGTHRVEAGGVAQTWPLSQRLGGGSLSGPAFVGRWKYLPSSHPIADVQVFDTAEHVFVVLSYTLNDAVTINQGHTTTMTILPSVLSLDQPTLLANRLSPVTNVDVDIFSRGGSLVEFSENIQISP